MHTYTGTAWRYFDREMKGYMYANVFCLFPLNDLLIITPNLGYISLKHKSNGFNREGAKNSGGKMQAQYLPLDYR